MKIGKYLLLIAIVVIVACNKDKFQTIPTIRIKSLSTHVVPANGSLVITLECTDKEGDVKDSVIIIKERQNIRVVPTIRDELRYKFPGFPTSQKTEIAATLDYQSILSAINPLTIPGSNPPEKEPDSLILKFVVRDNAGNTSDTIRSDRVIVIRN